MNVSSSINSFINYTRIHLHSRLIHYLFFNLHFRSSGVELTTFEHFIFPNSPKLLFSSVNKTQNQALHLLITAAWQYNEGSQLGLIIEIVRLSALCQQGKIRKINNWQNRIVWQLFDLPVRATVYTIQIPKLSIIHQTCVIQLQMAH